MSTRDAGHVRGLPNTDTTLRDGLTFLQATANRVGSTRASLDVLANLFCQLVAADSAETGSTTSVLTVTAHSALVGDIIVFTSGTLNQRAFNVDAVATNTITLGQTTSAAASNGDTFDILRISFPRVDSAGGVRIGTVSGTVTVDSELPAAATLADNTANPSTTTVGAFAHWYDGATWDRARGDSTDGLLVNLGTNNDVTITSGSITADTELPAAAALAENVANPTVPAVGSFGMLYDGATWDRAKGDSTDGALVNLGANNDVTASQAGTWTVQPGNTANTTAWKVDGSAVTQPISAASLPLPTSASTLAEQQTQTTALQLIDDAVATTGSAITAKGLAAAGTDGTNARILKTDTSGELQIDILTIAAGDNNIGNVDVLTIAAGDNNIGNVDVLTIAAGDNNIGNIDLVGGQVAHDAAVSGNPVHIAGVARTTDPTAVAAGDASYMLTDTLGKPVVLPYANKTNVVKGDTGLFTATTDQALLAAQGAGITSVLTTLTCVNRDTTQPILFSLKDGTTVVWRLHVLAGDTQSVTWPCGLVGTANTAWNIAINVTAVTSSGAMCAGYNTTT